MAEDLMMSTPTNVFSNTTKTVKTGKLVFLSQKVAYWQQLTQLLQRQLPQPEQWQVVCYEDGVLYLTGLNQAMVSQLNYVQAHYVAKLTTLQAFKDLNKIRARLRYDSPTLKAAPCIKHPMSPQTQQMLRETAQYVKDAKLSQALFALASDKK